MSTMQAPPASDRAVEDGTAYADLWRLIDEYCQSYELGESPTRRWELWNRLIHAIEQKRDFSTGTREIRLGDTVYRATRGLDSLVVYRKDLNGQQLPSYNTVSRLMRRHDNPLNRLLDEIEEEVRNVEYEHAYRCKVKDERGVDRPSHATDLLRRLADRLPGMPSNPLDDRVLQRGGAETASSTSNPKSKRGRPRKYNEAQDKRVFDAWKTGGYENREACARTFDMTPKEFARACDRERKRREQACQAD